jgi:hypothetical protein
MYTGLCHVQLYNLNRVGHRRWLAKFHFPFVHFLLFVAAGSSSWSMKHPTGQSTLRLTFKYLTRVEVTDVDSQAYCSTEFTTTV